jgi:hypothetical protein
MIQTTISGDKLILTAGLSENDHQVAVRRIADDEFGNIMKDGYFIALPERELIESRIEWGGKHAEFLKAMLDRKAKIYILHKRIPNDAAQEVGDIAVL